jgi:hypothetical protein
MKALSQNVIVAAETITDLNNAQLLDESVELGDKSHRQRSSDKIGKTETEI